ncbi:hypothetical protein F0U44_12540 [Nocardioides humilatus]|uniref:Uncharacterized protein n=1 Tax=Nocardioides humilatus TaxID=2607660 RepID=A0A5B1LI65_9ACTN|nr:hypothetical protein [Nocardioides humilatus]KAA1419267.1 hypothetical protein F0U44_12540 [Nocardioides humilatus]
MRRAVAVLLALSFLLTPFAGCTVSHPDGSAWRDQARQTLDDVASEVATASLVLEQLNGGRLPSSYGITMAVAAEEAASTAEEKLSSVQAPASLGGVPRKVLALIGRATEAVRKAREAVVAEHYDVSRLLRELDRLRTALDEQRAAL